jgi:hypothetical protein
VIFSNRPALTARFQKSRVDGTQENHENLSNGPTALEACKFVSRHHSTGDPALTVVFPGLLAAPPKTAPNRSSAQFRRINRKSRSSAPHQQARQNISARNRRVGTFGKHEMDGTQILYGVPTTKLLFQAGLRTHSRTECNISKPLCSVEGLVRRKLGNREVAAREGESRGTSRSDKSQRFPFRPFAAFGERRHRLAYGESVWNRDCNLWSCRTRT